MEREKAYEVVQRASLKAWDTGQGLKELLLADKQVVDLLGAEGLERCFDPAALLARTDQIFVRVFEQ